LTVEPNRDQQPSSGPSLWPIGFALGVACVLVGLIVGWPIAAVGGAIALIAGGFWARDSSRGYSAPVEHEPETRAARDAARARANAAGPAPVPVEDEVERYPRKVFLEGATLGIGVLIGGIITVPVVGLHGRARVREPAPEDVDLGPIDELPGGQFVIATFVRDPTQGEVSRRTAFIRNNGVVDGKPSFTIISNRCAHLGCPVQPNGPIFDSEKKDVEDAGAGRHDHPDAAGRLRLSVPRRPVRHRGKPHRRAARARARPLRVQIVNGRLVLLGAYSVAKVDGDGAAARSTRTTSPVPASTWTASRGLLYPWQPPPLMATTRQTSKSSRLVQVATYPLDWLEERSGLVGGVKYFLFRKVPVDIAGGHTLGSATLTAFLVQVGTGVILAMYYKPDPNSAYESIQRITNDITLGWLVRGSIAGAPASSSS
jgi:hypothetical protein